MASGASQPRRRNALSSWMARGPKARSPSRSATRSWRAGSQIALEAVRGIDREHALAFANPAARTKLIRSRDRRGAFQTKDHAFGFGDAFSHAHDRIIFYRERATAGLVYRIQDEKITERLRHGDTIRHRFGVV